MDDCVNSELKKEDRGAGESQEVAGTMTMNQGSQGPSVVFGKMHLKAQVEQAIAMKRDKIILNLNKNERYEKEISEFEEDIKKIDQEILAAVKEKYQNQMSMNSFEILE